ncbi:uncharacterized protein LOC118027043 isoform X1 [Mirounga leonina]|uniref:uncharacterized protein LOC118027043 isoform X1 n=1 Tax=Mirounga leonina TaxID=9715 RepID=UPI00156C1BEE|nr:uncharacterized protein LOC118027043 isoform X1 [Mirounga leonina]
MIFLLTSLQKVSSSLTLRHDICVIRLPSPHHAGIFSSHIITRRREERKKSVLYLPCRRQKARTLKYTPRISFRDFGQESQSNRTCGKSQNESFQSGAGILQNIMDVTVCTTERNMLQTVCSLLQKEISYERPTLGLRFLIYKAVGKIFKTTGFFYERKSYAETPKLIERETLWLKHRVGKHHQGPHLESSLFLALSCLWGTCLRSSPRHSVTTTG